MILAVIVACEIGFWVLIVLGLIARYPLRRPRLGMVLLAATPVVDLVLLVATAVDLRSGTTATVAHGLAAIYIGFSVAYGHRMITWADIRFAHHFADGPAPERLHGMAYTRHCFADVGRTAVAGAIAAALTAGLIAFVGDREQTQALTQTYRWMLMVLGVEVIWAVSHLVWPREPRATVEPQVGSESRAAHQPN